VVPRKVVTPPGTPPVHDASRVQHARHRRTASQHAHARHATCIQLGMFQSCTRHSLHTPCSLIFIVLRRCGCPSLWCMISASYIALLRFRTIEVTFQVSRAGEPILGSIELHSVQCFSGRWTGQIRGHLLVACRFQERRTLCSKRAQLLPDFLVLWVDKQAQRPLDVPLLLLDQTTPDSQLPRCLMKVVLAPILHLNEHKAALDSSTECAPHLDHAIATSKPPQDCGFVGNLLRAIRDADTEESGVRFRCDAVKHLIEMCVHAVARRRH